MSIFGDVVSGVGAYMGGQNSKKNLKQGYQGQVDASGQIRDLIGQTRDRTTQALNPYQQDGNAARMVTNGMLYGNPDDILENVRSTPGYQAAFREGIRGMDASAANRGSLLSGNQRLEAQRFGQDQLDQGYDRYIARYRPGLEMGYDATNRGIAADMGLTSAYGQTLQNDADAMSAYFSGKNGVNAETWGQISDAIGSATSGGGGKGGGWGDMAQLAAAFMGG